MTTPPAHTAPRLRVVPADAGQPDRWAGVINRVTRVAFARSGVLPGLPRADGAVEPEERVAEELRGGTSMWVAFRGDRAVGAVRAVPAEGAWRLRRLAVEPAERGHGVGSVLTRRLERDARRAGAPRVVLDAVVERMNPPFYAALGYRTLRHWPIGDKLLSEVTMERDLSTRPRRFAYPWEGEEGAPRDGLLVSWFSSGAGLFAVAGAVEGDAPAGVRDHGRALAMELGTGSLRFLGADARPGRDAAGVDGALEAVAGHAASVRSLQGTRLHLLAFAKGPEATVPFVLPRSVEPALLALWRVPWPAA